MTLRSLVTWRKRALDYSGPTHGGGEVKAFMAAGILAAAVAAQIQETPQEPPKLYLASKSAGNTWNAIRDQSQEMAKDFAKECPSVRVTTNERDADYQINLNHIELGLLLRDNQIAVTDMLGNLLSTKEKGSINSGVKGACALILADWSSHTDTRRRLVDWINASFQKGSVMGYAEISGDKLTVLANAQA
jgi:hypothetical protein